MRTFAVLPFALLAVAATVGATSHAHFDSRAESDGSFLRQGQTYEHAFAAAGTYNYHSTTTHDLTVGTVIVAADATASGRVDVQIKEQKFVPDVLRVKPGTTVVWTNLDAMEHSVTEDHDSPGPDAAATTPPPAQKDSPTPALAGILAFVAVVAWRRSA